MRSNSIENENNLRITGVRFGQLNSPAINGGKWIESLSRFRNALLSGEKETVKSFFKFPILNSGNDIWLVADMKFATTIDPNKVMPFKEADFDRYYSSILPIDFRKTLKEIDLEKLSRDKSTETPELTVVSPATNKMTAKYSEVNKSLTLSLITKSPDFGKYAIDYYFTIQPSGDIRFSHVKFIF
jgi:hypothetical protein